MVWYHHGKLQEFFVISCKTSDGKGRLMKKRKFWYLLIKILACRKLTFNNLMTFLNIPCERRYWMLEYDQHCFERLWEHKNETVFKELWKCEFRLKVETFQFVVNLVKNDMKRRDTFWRNAIAVKKRVAVAIWRLSTGNSFRTVSKVFGIGLSTSSEIWMEFCRIMSKLAHNFIKFPQNGQEIAITIRRFQAFTNDLFSPMISPMFSPMISPMFQAFTDGTYVEITCLVTGSRVDYYSQK